MNRRVALSAAASVALLLVGVVAYLLVPQDIDATDGALINVAQASAEAEAFTRRYPNANVTVDRSGRVAVDFTTPVARLRVFMGSGPRVTGALLECLGRPPIETNVADAARAGCS